MKKGSIQLSILTLILLVLVLSITVVSFFTIRRQRDLLFESADSTLRVNTEILHNTVTSIMLAGEAPLAIETLRRIRLIGELQEVDIYRATGESAFADYETLEFVNQYQEFVMFDRTERIEKTITENESFIEAVDTGLPPAPVLIEESQKMEFFFPMMNVTECWDCHGSSEESGSIRGVAHFTISVSNIYNSVRQSRNFLIIMFVAAGALLAVLLNIFLGGLIVKPLAEIGERVHQFGEGDMDVELSLKRNDEFGILANNINDMFGSVRERFELSKFVSKSTNDMISKRGANKEDGKRIVSAFFSDIRGFTKFSDTKTPAEVIEKLNQTLQFQAEIIENWGGDIDKFVGDEVMAIFENPLHAIHAAYEIIMKTIEINKDTDDPLYVGIGINTGEVISGNIGSKNRMEYAVIGDTINLASRLCSLAEAKMILISDQTYFEVKENVKAILIPNQKIKGKTSAVDIYRVKALKS